jgi:hypothetical protein
VSVQAARSWLAARVAAAPPALRERMDTALAGLPDAPGGRAGKLGAAALVCLRAALDAGPGRDAALPLLAADGLLTHGCEAAAEEAGDEGVAVFAANWGATRLAALLEADPPGA